MARVREIFLILCVSVAVFVMTIFVGIMTRTATDTQRVKMVHWSVSLDLTA